MRKHAPKPKSKSAERLAFEIYLRTGRLVPTDALERKFNPYHDPRNGQFTFAPGGPRSIADPIFSDRRGLWKPKAQRADRTASPQPTDVSKRDNATNSRTHRSALKPINKATSRDVMGTALGPVPASALKLHLPIAPTARDGFLLISDSNDRVEDANCPEGSTNCRATVTVTPRNSDDVDLALNEHRRAISESGWKDNDFQNLVDARYALLVLRQREAIAAGISDWAPTKLLPATWLAENIVSFDKDDPDSLARKVAYYMTIGIDGPGPRPALPTLHSALFPIDALKEQAAWTMKEGLHLAYQKAMGSDPIFASTASVAISGRNASTRGLGYEAEIRALYGGERDSRPPEFETMLDGMVVRGRTDHLHIVDGNVTVIEAKYTDNWMVTPRNPRSRISSEPWFPDERAQMIAQAIKYTSFYEYGIVYHTNSVQFARYYSKVFDEIGIKDYSFVITPTE